MCLQLYIFSRDKHSCWHMIKAQNLIYIRHIDGWIQDEQRLDERNIDLAWKYWGKNKPEGNYFPRHWEHKDCNCPLVDWEKK